MSKILVTGGCGFIGSHFVDLALSKKNQVINIDKHTYAAVRKNLKKENYTEIICDISKYKEVYKIINKLKPNYIINFAAESHVDNSIIDPNKSFKTNIIGTLNLVNCIRNLKLKCKFIQVSTDEVFGSLKLNDKSKFNQNSKYNPKSPYSASKASADHIVSSFSNTYSLNCVITYCTNNFGPRQHQEKFIPMILNKLFKKQKVNIYGNGKNVRDWIYVKDHCKILYKIMKNKKIKDRKFYISTNNEYSNLELTYLIIKRIYNRLPKTESYKKIQFVADRPSHDLRYSIDNKKIKKIFNFKSTDFFKAIDITINYYKKNLKKTKYFNYNKIKL
tara:strand:+ start:9007 stop:10002 length:996 start_codon:yes stop_codon:yes gene_type:complete